MRRDVQPLAAALLLLGLACQPAKPRATDTGSVAQQGSSGGEVDLRYFAPLPAQMNAGLAAPPTAAQVSLGRALFYENVLSAGHTISCNSCHALNAYGADGRSHSFGDHGQLGGRNAPSVYNAAGQVAQFWDGRAASIEAQAKGPVLNPAEMSMPDSQAVLAHLRTSRDYMAMFNAAFPGERNPITYDNVGRAIGAFERGLVTPSRWDRFLAGDSAALTAAERQGMTTFVSTGCATCHNGAYVGGGMYQKLGLVKAWPTSADSGRYAVTKNPSDLFVFKVPVLRNVAKTGPYFHDGSVATLPEAVRLMARHQLGKELTDVQVSSIVTYLGSLTGEIPVDYIAYPQLPAKSR